MRSFTTALAALFLIICCIPRHSSAAQSVQISESFVNVYENLDPKSTILKMVKKGDRLELVNAGTSWYQVKVGEKVGWVERKAGFLVDESSSVTNLLFAVLGILVLTGAVFGVSVYIKKQKPS